MNDAIRGVPEIHLARDPVSLVYARVCRTCSHAHPHWGYGLEPFMNHSNEVGQPLMLLFCEFGDDVWSDAIACDFWEPRG